MSLARSSTPALLGLACFAILAYAVAEHSLAPVHAAAYRKKDLAVEWCSAASSDFGGQAGSRNHHRHAQSIPTTRE